MMHDATANDKCGGCDGCCFKFIQMQTKQEKKNKTDAWGIDGVRGTRISPPPVLFQRIVMGPDEEVV